mmetsp:Transcript_3110/g.5473  ORF Transcript_3110/g.5473 Transcript_3110/m.5473 type:complete len:334 (+) Transcript_3110:33-1034(+)
MKYIRHIMLIVLLCINCTLLFILLNSNSNANVHGSRGNQQDQHELPILFGITTRNPFHSELLSALLDTWGSQLSHNESLFVYSGELSTKTSFTQEMSHTDPLFSHTQRTEESRNAKLLPFKSSKNGVSQFYSVQLPKVVDDQYPAIWKNVGQWEHMAAEESRFNWFVRCDDDVFLNLHQLRTFLLTKDHTKPVFLGRAVRGRPRDRKMLELNASYAAGGTCQFWSKAASFAAGLCRSSVYQSLIQRGQVYLHDDVELARCFYLNQVEFDVSMTKYLRAQNLKKAFKKNITGPVPIQTVSTLWLDSVDLHKVIAIHAVKLPRQMHYLNHKMYHS